MKEKGFTLIELLAVIVILAIIALITVPVVINIINSAKKGAAEDSTYGVIESAKIFWTSNQMDFENTNPNILFVCGNGTCTTILAGSNQTTLEISGTKPTEGTIRINNGAVTVSNLKFGDYYCSKEIDKEKVVCSTDAPYGYSISSNGYDAEDSSTISTTRLTNNKIYLKYSLTNGEVPLGAVPNACIYLETYPQKELCLAINEHNISALNILNYFGYDKDTWTNTSEQYWKDPNDIITCSIHPNLAGGVYCYDSDISIYSHPDGYIGTYDRSTGLRCYVYEAGNVSCWNS